MAWSAKADWRAYGPPLTALNAVTLPFSQQVTADATCRLLGAGSNLAAQIAVTSVFTGQVWGAVAGTAGVIGMEALGRASGCYNNPDDNPDFPSTGPSFMTGCKKVSGGWGLFQLYESSGYESYTNHAIFTEMIDVEFIEYTQSGGSTYRLVYLDRDGVLVDETKTFIDRYKSTKPYGIGIVQRGSCSEQATDDPVNWQPDTPIGPTYEYTDPETGCNWQIKPMDVYLDSKGQPVFHWKATSNDPASCGGPYEWWGNGQNPDIPQFEDPRGPDARPTPPTLPPGPGDDLKDRLDKIEEQLEQLKECACPEKPVQEGEYRTISFRSDETSPFGKSRLRKRFKYRSQSGLDLGAVVNHWRDFEFAAGPVAVGHVGSALGSPQVWAATADEGKRVIRHAGGEAGIDPDQVGEWRIGSSDNARYGVSGQMKVDTTGGYYWITARDGSNQRPIVART